MIGKLTALIQQSLENISDTANSNKGASKEELAKRAALALLIELSHADGVADPVEEKTLIETAIKSLGLTAENADQWLKEAQQSADDATSLYEFTELIHSTFTKNEKFELVINMWRVAYADGELDRYEDHLIRKVSELLYIDHADFIRAKHIAQKEQH